MPQKRLENPVVLLCSERSGSNLITRIFGSHPDFFAPSPAHLFRVFSTLDTQKDLSHEIMWMFRAKLAPWKLDEHWEKIERQALFRFCDNTPEMIAALLNAEGALRGRKRLFLKENSAHKFLPMLEGVSEDPRYVLMVRDPRDMAVSWVKAPTLRGGVVRSARRWLSDVTGSLAAMTPDRVIVQLTYEALVSRPEETLQRVCSELGVRFSDAMLQHVGNSEGVAQDATRTTLWGNLSRDIMSDNFNKFQGQLSDDEIAFIEALCGPLMAQFGYEKSRPDDAPAHGQHNSFEALEAALETMEPWTKPDYQELPEDERTRLEHWSSLQRELDRKFGVAATDPHIQK